MHPALGAAMMGMFRSNGMTTLDSPPRFTERAVPLLGRMEQGSLSDPPGGLAYAWEAPPAGGAGPESFGTLLRRYRLAAGLSQEALAERARLSPVAISALERGARRSPYRTTVQLLVQALELAAGDAEALAGAARPSRRPRAAEALPAGQAGGTQTRRWAAEPGLPTPEVAGHAPIPVPLTPMVDRERERADVAALLRRPEVRLVTLTGPGGVGKTRLALAVAAALSSGQAVPTTPVVFAPLGELRHADQVFEAIAQAVGLPPAAEAWPAASHQPSLEGRLLAHLSRARLLLVLDTFEHLTAAVPRLVWLLERCPHLQVLVTSRVPLRVRGEHVYPVGPLALPDPSWLAPASMPAGRSSKQRIAALARVPAVALFVQQAAAQVPGFELTADNAGAIAQIVCRLDGLPLAIELAAARSRVLTPQGLLARLGRRLPLLVGGPSDLPARQRTLRDTVAWSYDLLSGFEQRLLRALSVFPGGCTLEAAAHVCEPDATTSAPLPERRHELALVQGLAALVDSGLLQRHEDPDGSPRFFMPDTTREFAAEAAARAGELEHFEERLAHAVLWLAESAGLPAVPHAEQPNLGAALSWALRNRERETGRHLVRLIGPGLLHAATAQDGSLATITKAYLQSPAESQAWPRALTQAAA
jgi:predicted ATPase/transcriptional regulator with XRE-family HTH domain